MACFQGGERLNFQGVNPFGGGDRQLEEKIWTILQEEIDLIVEFVSYSKCIPGCLRLQLPVPKKKHSYK